VVLPNLEQCGLLEIGYKSLDDLAEVEEYYQANPFLASIASLEERKSFLVQILDFMRLAYALHYHLLDRTVMTTRLTTIREKLREPWTFEKDAGPASPCWLRVEKLRSNGN